MVHFKEKINANGFSVDDLCLLPEELNALINELSQHGALQFNSPDATDCNLLRIPFVKALADSHSIMNKVKDDIGNRAFAINAIILDKTKTANWGLDWHQDLKIAVRHKKEAVGYTQWSVESGIVHCIPPQTILEKRLTVRIHIDDCYSENGALLVIPGSHTAGILGPGQMDIITVTSPSLLCEIKKGGVMFMKPLLVHKSPYSATDRSRRILQIDYAGTDLDYGLQWY